MSSNGKPVRYITYKGEIKTETDQFGRVTKDENTVLWRTVNGYAGRKETYFYTTDKNRAVDTVTVPSSKVLVNFPYVYCGSDTFKLISYEELSVIFWSTTIKGDDMNIIKKEKEQEKQEKDNSFQPDEIMLIKFTTKTLYVPISDIDELVIDEIPGDAGTTQSDMVVLRVYTKKCHEGLSSREQAVQTLHTWTKWYNSHYRRYDVE